MEQKHPINEVLNLTMARLKEMIDVNTVIGTPITTSDGVTVIPISKVSLGFASGGSDFNGKNQAANRDNCFGGGTGAGVNITPVSFLIIRGDNVKVLPVDPVPGGPVEKAIDMVPEIVDKVTGLIEKQKEEKAASAAK